MLLRHAIKAPDPCIIMYVGVRIGQFCRSYLYLCAAFAYVRVHIIVHVRLYVGAGPPGGGGGTGPLCPPPPGSATETESQLPTCHHICSAMHIYPSFQYWQCAASVVHVTPPALFMPPFYAAIHYCHEAIIARATYRKSRDNKKRYFL